MKRPFEECGSGPLCRDSVLHVAGVDTLGARILIYECGGYINHVDASDARNIRSSIPRFEVCAHGIRLGCTFITIDGIRRLSKEMEDFKRCNTKVIQP